MVYVSMFPLCLCIDVYHREFKAARAKIHCLYLRTALHHKSETVISFQYIVYAVSTKIYILSVSVMRYPLNVTE